MTFEDVDKHVQAVDLNKLGMAPGAIDLCSSYKAVKPILGMVAVMPFFPAKWKAVVAAFIAALDVVCP